MVPWLKISNEYLVVGLIVVLLLIKEAFALLRLVINGQKKDNTLLAIAANVESTSKDSAVTRQRVEQIGGDMCTLLERTKK